MGGERIGFDVVTLAGARGPLARVAGAGRVSIRTCIPAGAGAACAAGWKSFVFLLRQLSASAAPAGFRSAN